tara:strand:+ start:198 stop:491 length:294 start_codon:yes stop_codon:yes gene_type:complete
MTKDNNKIKWKCRRGLWELDILLSKFAEFNYPLLSKENKLLFEELIDHEDVDLLSWLVTGDKANDIARQGIIDIVLIAHTERNNSLHKYYRSSKKDG